jgi:bacillithiol biosynthesis cysteine-adding enzyme BshC
MLITFAERKEIRRMKLTQVDYNTVDGLSKRDLAFIEQNDILSESITAWASIDAFKEVIEKKSTHFIDRDLLVSVLSKQYAGMQMTDATEHNIASLSSTNTFTIVTAHQPSLFTGPLYYIYKIASIINLSQKLSAAYRDYNFVPVFVSGGEDHDFEEINKVNIYQKQVVWENDESGPVGRMSKDGIDKALAELLDIIGDRSPYAEQLSDLLKNAVDSATNYSEINFHIINVLFGKFGLVYLNMDQAEFKRQFIPIIKDELLNQSSYSIVNSCIDDLESKGLKAQARPREINLFYFKKGIRERIVNEDGKYKVLNTDLSFEEADMLDLIEKSPELFSPNVLLRPLYQETILPNLAYIGGGGEIAYWTERKKQFEHYKLPFPLLIRRNSALQISGGIQKQLGKTPFGLQSFLSSELELTNLFLKEHVADDFSLSDSKAAIAKIFEELAQKATDVDQSLTSFVKAESTKQIKAIGHIEAKLKKAIKGKNDVQLSRISSVKSKLYPNNKLQERFENFAQYYSAHGDVWISFLVENLNPLERKYSLIELD